MDRCAVAKAARAAAEGLKSKPAFLIRQRDVTRIIGRSVATAVSNAVTAFPKKHFPAIHPRRRDARSGHLAVTMMREPVVRVANTDISGCDCGVVWVVVPRASTEPCSEGRQGTAKACCCAGPSCKTDDGQACYASPGCCGRRCGRRGTYLDRSVRYLGRLHGDASRQEGLFCIGETVVIQNQSAESPARSRLRFRLDASGGKSRQRSFDHDRIRAEAGLGILA